MELLGKVKEFVKDSFKGKQTAHFERTLYLVQHLYKPDADEALCIAAYSHDIERAFRDPKTETLLTERPMPDKEFLTLHQEKSADIIGGFLEQHGAEKKMIDRVKMLVSKHEIGGNEDQIFLKDCDSLSFFETNAHHFITKYAAKMGKDKIRAKLNWMFERISSEKIREKARPLYEQVLESLENNT